MGQNQSIESSLIKQKALISEIRDLAQELSTSYSTQFLDPTFCNRLALIYNDKLLGYQRQQLDDVSYILGIVSDKPSTKQKVCESIIKHYTDRIHLIWAIQKSLSYVSDRILALTVGPRCNSNPEIFDPRECPPDQWRDVLVMPAQSIAENSQWYQYLNQMQLDYLGNMRTLLSYLQQLQKFDKHINDERLKVLSDEAKQTIDNMHKNAYQMYKLILTTKTYTQEELDAYNEEQKIKEQEEGAPPGGIARGQWVDDWWDL